MSKTPEELQAEIDALKAQNATLIGEKRTATTKAAEAEAARVAAEAEAEAQRQAAATEKAKKDGDIKALEDALNAKHAAEVKRLQDELTDLKGARDKLVLDARISSDLDAAGVKPELKDAAIALIRAQNKAGVEIVNGEFVAKIGDKAVTDFVKDWAGSDTGKHFVGNANSGGGADGGDKGGNVTPKNPYHKDSINKTEQGKLEKSDPAKANKLRAEVGLPPLKRSA